MPTSYSWTLSPDPVPPGPSSGLTVPIGATPGVINPAYLTQADFLALFERILPSSYIDPIKNTGPGYELFQAMAEMWERVSLAIGRTEANLFITLATGGAKATVTVEFTRENALAGAVTMLAGTKVRTSVSGREFITLADAVFSGAALGPITATVESVMQGWEYNVKGQTITAASEVIAGSIDTIQLPYQSPAFGDPTILVRQIADATGGQCPFLDQHGADRGFSRNADETDQQYQARVRTLPDTVSPDAILRFLERYTEAHGLTYSYIETWQIDYQTCWDAPESIAANPDYDGTVFVYDDPRTTPPRPFQNRWLDTEEARGCFIVVVDQLPGNEWGMAFDDTATTLEAHTTGTFTRRAHSAFDVPTTANTDILQGAYDGMPGDDPLYRNQIYKTLFDTLQDIKAGGIAAIIEIDSNN